MGNQSSQGQNQQLSALKDYEQVSRVSDGVIYRKKSCSEQQTAEYFILKEHNFHNVESYNQASQKYTASLKLSSSQQSSTLSIKQVAKQHMEHFCSNSYKIFVLYQYPQLTLKDEIEVRAKEKKYFEECEIIAILQTCVLALEEIRAVICFGAGQVYISPDGVIKVTHNDLVDENYRLVVTPKIYYAPQKFINFMNESTSEIALKKEIIFSMGMTLLEACKLQPMHDVYDYSAHNINEVHLSEYVESLAERYSNELIDLLSNMLEPNPNRRISLLEVQRTLNRFDEMEENQHLNEEEENGQMERIQKEEMEKKCDKLFAYENQLLPRIKESSESNEQPSIPNILSHQNSARLSLGKNYNSKGMTHTNDEFYRNLQNSIEGYKITCKLAQNNTTTDSNNMTAHFQQPLHYTPISPVPFSGQSNDHLFTDPKLLQMIKKDLEQINKSRTSRIMYNSQHLSQSVTMSQNQPQNSITNTYNMMSCENQMNGSNFNPNSYDKFFNEPFTEYTTLNNCPQVQSLAASVAFESLETAGKSNIVYEESEVKRHPDDHKIGNQQKMKVSLALSTKNFASTKKNETQQAEPQTVRYPLREVSQNQNPASSLSSVEQEIKAAMMKKKESNLIYLQQIYQDGVKYEGMSKNGIKQGYGKLLYNDGAYYEGYFHDDKISGKGILYYKKNQPAYDGEWLDQQFNGYGQLYNEQPQQLEEQFPFHNWNFLENYWIKYEGEFLNDNKHGNGKIILTSHEFIQGEFQDDMLNGWATFFRINGDKITGRYQNNVLVQLANQ